MTNTDLHEAMLTLAEGAPAPPPDLLDRVEAGHRRRRRTRAVVAAFAAVLLVAAGAWVVWRPVERPNPVVDFPLPELPKHLPVLTETWPSATVVVGDLPSRPDADFVDIAGRIDPGHLLGVSGDGYTEPGGELVKPGGIWSYAVADQTSRRLVTGMQALPNHTVVTVTERSLVWTVQRRKASNEVELWWATPAGGSKRLVTVLKDTSVVDQIYTDDRYVYFTRMSDGTTDALSVGIMRVSLTNGVAELIPGTGNLFTDGSPWAADKDRSVFRHLSTGEVRRVARPGGTDRFDCVPAFCLGHDQRGWFVQAVDGTRRTGVPYAGEPRLIGGLNTNEAGRRMDTGLLVLPGDVLLDPVQGKFGRFTEEPHCQVGWYALKGEQVISWYPTTGGKCDLNAQVRRAYIGAGD